MSRPKKPGQALAASTSTTLGRSLAVNALGDIRYSAVAQGDHSHATVVVQAPGPQLRATPIYYRLRSLPEPYSRPERELDALCAAMLDSGQATLGVVGESRGLLGMGGIGKTVLAVALTHEPSIRAAFSAGIVWLSFGRDADLRARQDELILALTGAPSTAASTQQAHGLIGLLAQQLPSRLLVVLDDVWEGPRTHAAFRDLPANVQLLVTSRDRQVLECFGGTQHRVGLLETDEALDFLASSASVSRAALPPQSGEILRRCGGLRLALAAVGALIRGGVYDWSDVRQALSEVRLDEFPDRWREEPDLKDLASVLKVSLDALGPEARVCLNDFAVFQEDVAIPRDALLNLWARGAAWVLRSKQMIAHLVDRSILIGDAEGGYLVHDLYRDFLRDLLVSPNAQHRDLIARYQSLAKSGWAAGPNDGYFFQALPWHLREAGDALKLLFEPDWLRAKLKATDAGRLIADCRLAPSDPQIKRLGAALVLAAEAIRDHPADLLAQVCGRLTESDGEDIAQLLKKARAALSPDQMIPERNGFLDRPGRLMKIFRGHRGFINAIAVSSDGRRAVSGAQDQTLILWNLETGDDLLTFRGHQDGVNAVCLFADHNTMVSGDDQGRVLFWRLDQEEPLEVLSAGMDSVDVLVALSDGWRAVSAGEGEGLLLWDAVKRQGLGPVAGSSGRVISLAALSDGRVLSGDLAGRVVAWDITGSTPRQVLWEAGEPIRLVLALPEDRLLAIDATGLARIWSIAGELIAAFGPVSIGHHAFATAPELGLLASGLRDGGIDFCGLFDGEPVNTVKAHGDQVSVLAAVPGRAMMLSGSMDETLRLWDLSALGQSGCDRQSAILSLGFPPRSSALVVGLENGAVEVRDHWDRPGRRVGSHAEGVRALAILGDGRSVLTACSGGGVRISDLSGGEERILIPCHTRSISRISILDEHRVVLLGGHGGLEILDLRTGVVTATQPAHPSGIASGAVLPDGAVVTGGHDGVICLWDPETGEVIKRMTSPDEVGPINAIVPRRGGSQLVAVTGNGWIYVWDLVGNIPISIQGGEAFARNPRRGFQLAHGFLDACMLHDAPILALCCGDKTVRLWDLTRGEATRRFADDHLAAACVFDAVLGRLVVANQHGRLQVFDLSNIAFSD